VNLTISPPIRILALVGLLAIVALGASTLLLGHSSQPSTSSREPVHVQRRHTTPAVTHTTPAKPVTKPHTLPAVVHKAAKPKAAPKPKPNGNLVYADLPAPLQWELSQHKVVVVSFYDPKADVDSIAVAEAHAGALDAGAGFLLVSVLDNKVAGILTALLPGGGLLPDPGVFVYRAPGTIATRIDGFADRASVAQAAQNALTATS
jgi:hypothetical protein